MRKGTIVRNRYYTDTGMEYVYDRMTECLAKFSVTMTLASPTLFVGNAPLEKPESDFVLFWDKDVALCKAIEQSGVQCFNRAAAIAVCDDKLETYLALAGKVKLIDTVAAPLRYPVNDGVDRQFLQSAIDAFGFPMIVKARTGSRGEQVRLVQTLAELETLARALAHTPFVCQRYVEMSAGRDVRVYVIGGVAVCALTRQSADFKSNLAAGGKATPIDVAPWRDAAETAANTLSLDYCAVDFLTDGSLVEVNSNAYFTAAEQCGLNVADAYARHIVRCVYDHR